MGSNNVTWTQGDATNGEEIVVLDPTTLEPVDLTGAKVWLYAKRSMSDADDAAVVAIDSDGTDVNVTDPAGGKFQYAVPADALAVVQAPTWLYYAAQVRLESGASWEILRGVAYVQPGIVAAT